MKYLPFEKLEYHTCLSTTIIQERLAAHMEPFKLFRWRFGNGGNDRLYQGKLDSLSFDIHRVVNGKNSFRPEIIGVFEDHGYERVVLVQMRLNWFVFGFLIIWATPFIVIGLIALSGAEPKFALMALVPIVFLIVVFFAFKSETAKTRAFLREIFEAEEVEIGG